MIRSDDIGIAPESCALRRFHFDLEAGDEIIKDREGVDASSLNEAVTQAQAIIAEMRDADDLAEPGVWTLAIRTAGGAVLKRLTVE